MVTRGPRRPIRCGRRRPIAGLGPEPGAQAGGGLTVGVRSGAAFRRTTRAAPCRSIAAVNPPVEEDRILPLAEKYVTAAEWRQLGEHSMGQVPKKALPLAFGMAMYEGDIEVVKSVPAYAPLPARLILPFLAPRLYAKHAMRVYGTATPPRITRPSCAPQLVQLPRGSWLPRR